jgi:hypothetical protein
MFFNVFTFIYIQGRFVKKEDEELMKELLSI